MSMESKKNAKTFEHIEPAVVGNARRFLLSEISGRSAILDIIRRFKPDISRDRPRGPPMSCTP